MSVPDDLPPTRDSTPYFRLRFLACWIAAGYAGFATLWIYFSDQALGLLVPDPRLLIEWSVYKGLGFVAVTSIFLFVLLRRAFDALEKGYESLRTHEIEIQRLNRLYSALSHVNQAIVRMPTRDELFQETCRILVENGGFPMAWIGWHDSGTQLLVPVARCGEGGGFLDRVRVSADEPPDSRGPTGSAFREGRHFICNDMLEESATQQGRDEFERLGLRASAAFPIRQEGQVRGVLTVFADEPGLFQDKEIALLDEAAVDVSFGLDNLVREDEGRRAESATVRTLQRLTDAQRIGRIGDWELDLASGAIFWSPQVFEIFGRDPGSGPPPRFEEQAEFLDAPSMELMKREVDAAISSGESREYELEALRPDGGRVHVRATAVPRKGENGEVVALFGTVQDVTERKLLESQFLRAQRMESVGTLAGGIAHDLNNALAPITMALEMLKMRFPDSASQELLGIVSSSAHRGADMVRQVLTFARGVEGRRVEVRVRHLIEEIERIANETFLKHIEVRTSISDSIWPILGDPTQLHQVLLNLCVNARDAMPHGGLLILSAENVTLDAHYAGMHADAQVGPHVLIQVEDSGTGMPQRIIEKIFDPFFTTKGVGKGTGLGLSTSLAIVKSHGGFIRVESELGEGTRFKIHLPALSGLPSVATLEPTPDLPRGEGELVLVVDDETFVRQITRQTLETFGYQVVLAADGAEAVAVFASRGAEIDVVLTDMTMPVMDGPATIQVLRKMDPGLRIIAASGLATEAQLAHAARLGVKNFLPKPYTAEALLTTLREVLRNN